MAFIPHSTHPLGRFSDGGRISRTTEAGNVGPKVGPYFFSNLTQMKPGKVLFQGVNDYPADIWGYLLGGSDSGAKNMANLVGQANSKCPNSKIVLSGYRHGFLPLFWKG